MRKRLVAVTKFCRKLPRLERQSVLANERNKAQRNGRLSENDTAKWKKRKWGNWSSARDGGGVYLLLLSETRRPAAAGVIAAKARKSKSALVKMQK